ncbi:MAG: gamma-glutamylcyclotransferase [Pseudomonadota bacterium]
MDGGYWVFGYGSLMWKPGFAYVDRRHAVLSGYARRFCLWSLRYRGTAVKPGLVLGLAPDPDAETRGMAFRVPGASAEEAWGYLADRELTTAAYHETTAPLRFTCRPESDERAARAVAYVIDPAHRQYAAGLSLRDQAEIIADSAGMMGRNADYLFNTVAHLRAIAVRDEQLEALARMVRVLRGEDPDDLDTLIEGPSKETLGD